MLHNGVLRVATTTEVLKLEQVQKQRYDGTEFTCFTTVGRAYNCNLYCIDLSSWEIASSVKGFAPDGEEVKSARFDGPMGYICTAEVVIMEDPVYYFDLSDIYNITYKHTPIIDGYSSSLTNFGDYLLGIGYNEDYLKVEAYKETADGVESITSYERDAWFSSKYKSYYIDRENNLVGLAMWDDPVEQGVYVLLQFDGHQFVELIQIPITKLNCAYNNILGGYIFHANDMSKCRADIIDGYLYLLEETLHVKRLWVE